MLSAHVRCTKPSSEADVVIMQFGCTVQASTEICLARFGILLEMQADQAAGVLTVMKLLIHLSACSASAP